MASSSSGVSTSHASLVRRKRTSEKSEVKYVPSISDIESIALRPGVMCLHRKINGEVHESVPNLFYGPSSLNLMCRIEEIQTGIKEIFTEMDGIPKELQTFFENALNGRYSIINNYFFIGNPIFVTILKKACTILLHRFPEEMESYKYELRIISDVPFPTKTENGQNFMYNDVLMFIPTVARCIYTPFEEIIQIGQTIRDIVSKGQSNTTVIWSYDTYLSRHDSPMGTEKVYSITKVGRNEKCPCGSDIKFKICCGKM